MVFEHFRVKHPQNDIDYIYLATDPIIPLLFSLTRPQMFYFDQYQRNSNGVHYMQRVDFPGIERLSFLFAWNSPMMMTL